MNMTMARLESGGGHCIYQPSDNITANGRDQIHRTTQHLLEQGVVDTPLVIQIPHTYVNRPLQKVGEVVVLLTIEYIVHQHCWKA